MEIVNDYIHVLSIELNISYESLLYLWERELKDVFIRDLNMTRQEPAFSLSDYFELLDKRIGTILMRPEKDVLTYDILDTKKSAKNKMIVLKEKQRQMKIGEIWQEVLGNYNGCINLKTGHETGLDIISHTKKFAIELKSRTNTDNSSSKLSNLDKLSMFKKNNPEYRCIYANINDNTKDKTIQGYSKKILHKGVVIEKQVGYKFLNFILGEDMKLIIDFVKLTIDKYT
jgi:hypothetical protein